MNIKFNKEEIEKIVEDNSDYLNAFITENRNLLNSHEFDELYAETALPQVLTALFLLSDIDFLSIISDIPIGCFRDLPIKELEIPDTIRLINAGAFYDCTSLTNVKIPKNITSIGFSAFFNCESLTSITIPNRVTVISHKAFCDCHSLTSIIYTGTKKQWRGILKDFGWNANVPETCVIHCIDGNLNLEGEEL